MIRPRTGGRAARPQDGRVIYAIGDVHGRLDLLRALVARIEAEAPDRALVLLLGDLIDRGPDSAGVIDWAIRRMGTRTGLPLLCLRGNHEQAMLAARADPHAFTDWAIRYGGAAALASYGVEPAAIAARPDRAARLAAAVPDSHWRFIASLPLMHRTGDYVFAHAGIDPARPLDRQDAGALLQIRRPFLDCPDDLGVIVIHGHTPVDRPEIRLNRIGIDTLAVRTGRLTAARIAAEGVRFLATGE